MKYKSNILFLVLLAAIILVVIIADFFTGRPGRLPENPYKLETQGLLAVDSGLVTYRETRNFRLPMEIPTAVSCLGDRIFVAGDQRLLILDTRGVLVTDKTLDFKPLCIKAVPGKIYAGGARRLAVLDSAATILAVSDAFEERSVITSVDAHENVVFAADAGQRVIHRLDPLGKPELTFEGKADGEAGHGFIVPSPCFDLAVNGFGELWVANPGKHSLENYSSDGSLRGWWGGPGQGIRGFGGCCNPAHFTFLPSGNFITSEKGIVRIKEYLPSGELMGVVAPPSLFREGGHAPDVACDAQGRVYALDPDRRMIRVFEKK